MICIEYAILKEHLHEAQEMYNKILLEEEALFQRTQPSAIRYDKDKVQTTPKNPLETYTEQKEAFHIEARLREAKYILEQREILLESKKSELYDSKIVTDLIYRYKNLDNIKISHIAEMLGFSRSQVYRILQVTERKIKDATKCDK